MPTTKSAKKRLRQSEERRLRNRSERSALRTYVRRVLTAIEANDPEKAREEMRLATVKLDRAGTRGLIHRNKAARIKSRLAQRIKAMQQQAPA
jgi:small subunit ribosomal protein S20